MINNGIGITKKKFARKQKNLTRPKMKSVRQGLKSIMLKTVKDLKKLQGCLIKQTLKEASKSAYQKDPEKHKQATAILLPGLRQNSLSPLVLV